MSPKPETGKLRKNTVEENVEDEHFLFKYLKNY